MSVKVMATHCVKKKKEVWVVGRLRRAFDSLLRQRIGILAPEFGELVQNWALIL